MSTMKMYRYSEAFKQQVVKEIEEGTLRIAEAARIYDISVAGIYKWLHNLGKDHLIGKVVYVKKRNELDKIKKLELEKKQLEAALAKSHLSVFCLESMIEAAEKAYGIDIKKKLWYESIEEGRKRMSKEKIRFNIGQICGYFGYSRQGYYRHRQLERARRTEEELVVTAVKNIRRTQPRAGSRKLKNMLSSQGIDIGRDRLFDMLRAKRMLVERHRAYHKTTNSLHGFGYHPNLIKDLEIRRSAQVYVSDITYIHTLEGFIYLSLVTDHYSRKIVGYNLSESLSVEGSLKALKMSLKHVKNPQTLIHHSDRGIQYCSKAYTDMLRNHGVSISMTEEDHVYENALAERVNGILKDEFYLGQTLRSKTIAHKLVRDSIRIYNQKRLHMALNYHTPDSVFYAA